MSLILIGIGVVILLIFLLNTRRWIAIGRGMRRSRTDLEDELRELRGGGGTDG